eukprot:3856448-Prorocentrum_lima.AAC.1
MRSSTLVCTMPPPLYRLERMTRMCLPTRPNVAIAAWAWDPDPPMMRTVGTSSLSVSSCIACAAAPAPPGVWGQKTASMS